MLSFTSNYYKHVYLQQPQVTKWAPLLLIYWYYLNIFSFNGFNQVPCKSINFSYRRLSKFVCG